MRWIVITKGKEDISAKLINLLGQLRGKCTRIAISWRKTFSWFSLDFAAFLSSISQRQAPLTSRVRLIAGAAARHSPLPRAKRGIPLESRTAQSTGRPRNFRETVSFRLNTVICLRLHGGTWFSAEFLLFAQNNLSKTRLCVFGLSLIH